MLLLFLRFLAVANGKEHNVTAESKSDAYSLVLMIRYPDNLSEGNI